jgi:hypothetical protein
MTGGPPPYRPLRGADPPHFVDREDPQDVLANGIVVSSIAAYRAGPCDPRFHRLVIAGPAMGKTALLRTIGREVAVRLNWAVTLHSCRPKERALGAVPTAVVKSLQHRWPAEISGVVRQMLAVERPLQEPVNEFGPASRSGCGGSSWAALKCVLDCAGNVARAVSCGLLVMLDDADRLGGGEVEALGYLARSLSRDGLPVAILFSGGPQLEERFARAGDLSDCFWLTRLGRLDESEAREALVVPAADRGVEFQQDALELLCLAAGGSPLVLQRLGFAAWSAAAGAEVVTVADAHSALDLLTVVSEAKAS